METIKISQKKKGLKDFRKYLISSGKKEKENISENIDTELIEFSEKEIEKIKGLSNFNLVIPRGSAS